MGRRDLPRGRRPDDRPAPCLTRGSSSRSTATRLSDDDLRSIAEIQVEEAADAADAAALTAAVEASDDGCVDEPARPADHTGDGARHPDLPRRRDLPLRRAARRRWGGRSTPRARRSCTVKALDHTLELDREEKIVAWPGTADSAIAESIFATYGFERRRRVHARRARSRRARRAAARDRPRLPARAGTQVGLRRLPRELRRPASTGHFAPIDPLADPQGELSLGFGGDARRVQVDARLVRRPARQGAAHPAAFGHRAERRRDRRRPGAGLDLARRR